MAQCRGSGCRTRKNFNTLNSQFRKDTGYVAKRGSDGRLRFEWTGKSGRRPKSVSLKQRRQTIVEHELGKAVRKAVYKKWMTPVIRKALANADFDRRYRNSDKHFPGKVVVKGKLYDRLMFQRMFYDVH